MPDGTYVCIFLSSAVDGGKIKHKITPHFHAFSYTSCVNVMQFRNPALAGVSFSSREIGSTTGCPYGQSTVIHGITPRSYDVIYCMKRFQIVAFKSYVLIT